MTTSGPITTRFRVGHRWCELTMQLPPNPDLPIRCEWTPDFPRKLSMDELRQYRRGRDNLLAEAGRLIGSDVLVLEV
jgi:hypothetical protein